MTGGGSEGAQKKRDKAKEAQQRAEIGKKERVSFN